MNIFRVILIYENKLPNLLLTGVENVQPDEVVVTTGCMEAIVMCLRAVTKSGDTVVVEKPAYFGIYQAMESLGLKVIEIYTDPQTGPDLDILEKILQKFYVKACLFVPEFQ